MPTACRAVPCRCRGRAALTCSNTRVYRSRAVPPARAALWAPLRHPRAPPCGRLGTHPRATTPPAPTRAASSSVATLRVRARLLDSRHAAPRRADRSCSRGYRDSLQPRRAHRHSRALPPAVVPRATTAIGRSASSLRERGRRGALGDALSDSDLTLPSEGRNEVENFQVAKT